MKVIKKSLGTPLSLDLLRIDATHICNVQYKLFEIDLVTLACIAALL